MRSHIESWRGSGPAVLTDCPCNWTLGQYRRSKKTQGNLPKLGLRTMWNPQSDDGLLANYGGSANLGTHLTDGSIECRTSPLLGGVAFGQVSPTVTWASISWSFPEKRSAKLYGRRDQTLRNARGDYSGLDYQDLSVSSAGSGLNDISNVGHQGQQSDDVGFARISRRWLQRAWCGSGWSGIGYPTSVCTTHVQRLSEPARTRSSSSGQIERMLQSWPIERSTGRHGASPIEHGHAESLDTVLQRPNLLDDERRKMTGSPPAEDGHGQ